MVQISDLCNYAHRQSEVRETNSQYMQILGTLSYHRECPYDLKICITPLAFGTSFQEHLVICHELSSGASRARAHDIATYFFGLHNLVHSSMSCVRYRP